MSSYPVHRSVPPSRRCLPTKVIIPDGTFAKHRVLIGPDLRPTTIHRLWLSTPLLPTGHHAPDGGRVHVRTQKEDACPDDRLSSESPGPARSLTHADESAMNATVRRRTNRYYVMIISPFVVSKINTTERPRLCIFMQHHNI